MTSVLRHKFFLIFIYILFITSAKAQNEKISAKISPLIQKAGLAPSLSLRSFRIMVKGTQLPQEIQSLSFDTEKIAGYDSVSFYLVHTNNKELVEKILPLANVLFVEEGTRIPKEEVLVNNLDLSTNKINVVHRKFPQWNGEGLTVSIKENKPDTTDIDFKGRFVTTPLSASIISSHATNMATMVAGGGNSWYLGKGAAWASLISSSNFANLLPDPLPVLKQYNITVQNHSYGVGVENFYGADAGLYDANTISDPVMINVFSAGNSGTLASTTGPYTGINAVANLTGSFKMAKNIITVGATDSFGNVALQSSRGPAFDGRVKPEMVAFGIDGSSGAAALVSGVSLILQQEYKQINGSLPTNALLKAVLLNSADDRGNKEIDYANGFGSLNALNAVKTIQAGHFMNGSITNGSTQNFSLLVPAGIKKLKITLVWNDPAALPNATKALINDLDLELFNSSNSQTWMPWVLNSFPHIDSLKQLATRKKDSINNVEQITVDAPPAGHYQVYVKGYAVTSASQTFYIAYQLDSTDIFEWHFPMATDPVFPSAINTLRWNSTFAAPLGKLDFSIDNGVTWQLIDPAVNLSNGHYNWNTPASTTASLLKMTIDANQIISDTFVIASRTQTGVGFNCPDSFLFYWNKITPVSTYRLFRLGNRYMEPILLTLDSFVVLQKNVSPSLYYAVSPVIAGREGVRSYTINYTIQGVECYVSSFLAILVNNTAELSLSLGSLYNINKIVLEKFDGTSFKPVQQLTNNFRLSVKFVDNNLTKGLNIYRIKLELAGGRNVYSLIENVFYFNGTNYLIYPNPAQQYKEINIAQENVDVALMQVFNATGVKVFEKNLDDRINKIPAGKLSKGFYFIHFLNNGNRKQTLKLVVY